jgi:multimeric flavodoxin WrbA
LNKKEKMEKTIKYLKRKKKVLFITTSTRWSNEKEKPKSTLLAERIAQKIGQKVRIIDSTKLKIYTCEGNVSAGRGNDCGPKKAVLHDELKNPSGFHRCWASINNQDDELWKITRELFDADAIVFFSSVRWGQTNSEYQKLIERLTWIENRHATFGETNIVGKISAGIILTGHNWRGKEILETEKLVLGFFGFKVPEELSWNWQYTEESGDETEEGYKKDSEVFGKTFLE